MDFCFEIYQVMSMKENNCVLRFCRSDITKPLYYSDKNQLNEVPNCQVGF